MKQIKRNGKVPVFLEGDDGLLLILFEIDQIKKFISSYFNGQKISSSGGLIL